MTTTDKNLSIYENAKHWIVQYESVDEVKEYIDKAAAVQEYSRRALDFDMETLAARARVRAERRAGELLKEMDKAQGKRTDLVELYDHVDERPTLDDMGLTKDQSSKWQQLAEVPEPEFEKAVSVEGAIPSTNGILTGQKEKAEPKRIDRDALYLWGELIRFEKRIFNRPVNGLLDQMTPAMVQDMQRIVPKLKSWIGEFE